MNEVEPVGIRIAEKTRNPAVNLLAEASADFDAPFSAVAERQTGAQPRIAVREVRPYPQRWFRESEQPGWVDFPRDTGMIAASVEKTLTRRPRRNFSPAFKAKASVAAIKSERALIDLAQDFDFHPDKIKQWRDQLLDWATGVLARRKKLRRNRQSR